MKSHGMIGFSISSETSPGVWTQSIIEKDYAFDVTRNRKKWSKGESANDDLTISNEVNIVANDFTMEHYPQIKYVTWMGSKWKVTDIAISYPGLTLTLGGLYNG